MERDAGAEARRDPVPHRATACRAQGGAQQAHDARDGQGPAGGAWRRAGGDRRRLLHGRGGPAALRADGAVRDAGQVRDGDPPADRRGRDHHAMELPGRDPGVEAVPRAHLRQHRRHQARFGHAGVPRPLRRAPARGRPARGRRERRHRLRCRGRQRDRRPPRHPGHQLHRPYRHGRRDQPSGGRDAEARQPRARRQEPDRDLGGRGPRPRARQCRLVGVRDLRTALHRGVTPDRPSVHPRRLRPSASAASGEARPRRRPRRDDRRRSRDQRIGHRAHRVYAAIGRNEGELVIGGEPARDGALAKGSFFEPTIFAEVKPDARIAQEEIFGPVTSVIPVDTWDEAVRVVNG